MWLRSLAALALSSFWYWGPLTDPTTPANEAVIIRGGNYSALRTVNETDNERLWLEATAHPDSVAAQVVINSCLVADLQFSGTLRNGFYLPTRIRVRFSDGRMQDLEIKDAINAWQEGHNTHPYVRFDDCNFDGNADLRLFDNCGASGNLWYTTWLFDPVQERFVPHQGLSEMSHPMLDPEARVIRSYNHFGGCEESVLTYHFNGKELVTESGYFCQIEDGNCITKTARWSGSAWIEIGRGVWEMNLYDSLVAGARPEETRR